MYFRWGEGWVLVLGGVSRIQVLSGEFVDADNFGWVDMCLGSCRSTMEAKS